MELEIRPAAREDLESIRERDRVRKKIDDIWKKVEEYGIPPEKAVEKRLSGGWHPLLQQRAGDHRIWFLEGERTDKGEDDVLYVVRILDKSTQKDMKGVDISPDTFL